MPRATRRLAENHERWLVSYADFVTLMFAFFVVLFAYSTMDQTKMESFAARFESYVQQDAGPLAVAPRRASAAGPVGERLEAEQAALQHQALTRAEMSESIQQLEAELLPDIKSGKIDLSLQPRGLVMSLRESAFFAPGDAALQAASLAVMARVAQSLTKIRADSPGRPYRQHTHSHPKISFQLAAFDGPCDHGAEVSNGPPQHSLRTAGRLRIRRASSCSPKRYAGKPGQESASGGCHPHQGRGCDGTRAKRGAGLKQFVSVGLRRQRGG